MCALPSPRAQRPPACTRTSKNSCALLASRYNGSCSNDFGRLLASNLKILRNIILKDDTEFVKVWSKTSKSLISYESGRIYFDNYRCCYSSLLPEPELLYELPRTPKTEKIEDALLCQCPLENVLPNASEQKSCLLTLTANNWLYLLSADTGETLQRVYLSSRFKFSRSLGWDSSQETFYVKSVQCKQTALERQAGVDNNILMRVAAFQVFPLQLVGMLEINKKVFGKTAVDVLLSQGVLAVSHSSKLVRLYSFEYIVNKFRTEELILGQQCELNNARGIVGDAPYGVPVNICIHECPPVLFEMTYFENGVQIGGHPWHYIYTPNHKRHRGTHHVCSITDGALAKNGVQDMKCDSLEVDWIFFHPDDSGRIIHAGPSTINILKIMAETGCDWKYEIITDFSITAARDSNASQVIVTSSGRTVKRRFQMLDDDPAQETFRMVKYEDELDLLAVVDITHAEDEGQARLRLHDNKTGALMKRVPLEEPWDVTYSHEVYFDRDTIIHTVQEKNNSFCCHVYKMKRPASDQP
ncbi:DDB1- and CUL4-associated factor 17 [Danio rerio]|uniref:DDB1- and CUL4-associated factor 17 n=1 Tax=Danio rerio TaxID=7955 RepID=DCA17_DANRE|nr:DDB1- and CUL4-associated factor 17 [Danio rerio]A8WHR0.1 RecName: Full=DDB1- and CUL4-associated factor 17 [Danio rerio]|eukprot:NP_001138261.1 DDB1- and CUL4-associated factor 17 [Danio rerio]